MKKLVVWMFFLLYLCAIVFAVPSGLPNPKEGIVRINDFETDNVHILRLGNFTRAVVVEVEKMREDVSLLRDRLVVVQSQLEDIKKDSIKTSVPVSYPELSNDVNQITSKLVSIESELRNLKSSADSDKTAKNPELSGALFMLNLLIFLIVIGTFLFVRKKVGNEKYEEEFHAQLHLNNAVRHTIKNGSSVDKVRDSFVLQGWSEERVNRALEAAVK